MRQPFFILHYVLDSMGWVQERRVNYLRRYFPDIEFKVIQQNRFEELWQRGRLEGGYIYFASWRILAALCERGAIHASDDDFSRFMTSVTSHYNLGGGLDVTKALRIGAEPVSVFNAATNFLRRCRVVTVNSRILYDLLADDTSALIYAPNGVDADLFCPRGEQIYDPANITVGWVGKIKAAKNHELALEVFDALKRKGIHSSIIAPAKGTTNSALRSEHQMHDFYSDIQFYLCTSWHEGTPNPALEAAACGVPVVSTRVGNMPELVDDGENGFLVEPNADSIIRVFDEIIDLSRGAYELMSSEMRRRVVAEWTWERNSANYSLAFSRLIGSNLEPCPGVVANGVGREV